MVRGKYGNELMHPGELRAHLLSEPPPRMPGWQPYTAKRDFDKARAAYRAQHDAGIPPEQRTGWMNTSYPKKTDEQLIQMAEGHMPIMMTTGHLEVAVPPTTETRGTPGSYVVPRSDALTNINYPVLNHCVEGMASQGNCLEAPTPSEEVRLSAYVYDNTQGARCAMTTVDATLSRKAHPECRDMMQIIFDKHPEVREMLDYTNGYLLPLPGKSREFLDFMKNNKDLWINVQQARVDGDANDNQHITQIPMFALPLSWDVAERDDDDKAALQELSEHVLAIQFQAIARVAVFKSQVLGERVPLLLTPVGGGAFGNNQHAIARAMDSMNDILVGQNVDVMLSAYREDECDFYRQNCRLFQDALVISDAQMQQIPFQGLQSTEVAMRSREIIDAMQQMERQTDPNENGSRQIAVDPDLKTIAEQKSIPLTLQFARSSNGNLALATSEFYGRDKPKYHIEYGLANGECSVLRLTGPKPSKQQMLDAVVAKSTKPVMILCNNDLYYVDPKAKTIDKISNPDNFAGKFKTQNPLATDIRNTIQTIKQSDVPKSTLRDMQVRPADVEVSNQIQNLAINLLRRDPARFLRVSRVNAEGRHESVTDEVEINKVLRMALGKKPELAPIAEGETLLADDTQVATFAGGGPSL